MRLGLAGDLAGDQRGPDIAGADRVAGHPALRPLERGHLGQPDHAVLGRHVGRLEGRGDQPVRRGDVDDAPPATLLHGGQRGAGGVEGGGEVDGDDRVPLLRRELLDRRDVLDAGIVDQDVDAAELGAGALDQRRHLGGLRHVGRVVAHRDAMRRGEPRARRLDLLGLAEAVQRDRGAGRRQRLGDAEADAAGRAGDDGRATGERPPTRGSPRDRGWQDRAHASLLVVSCGGSPADGGKVSVAALICRYRQGSGSITARHGGRTL